MRFIHVGALVLLFCCPRLASAQSVKLEFHDGKVNLTTQNAPLRTILSEWARLGGTQIVNVERVPGTPVTLQLTDVSETQALDSILRGAAGYIAGARPATTAANAPSAIDRIFIVSTIGTAAAVAARPVVSAPFVQPAPQPVFQPDPDDNPVSDVPPDDERPANRNTRGVPPPLTLPRGGQAVTQPFQPQEGVRDDTQPQPAATPTPANPFGIQTGSARPGVITTAPPQPQRPQNQRDPEP